MFPFRYSTIFRNRWFAVLWAAGICWMAIEFAAPDPETASGTEAVLDVTGSPVSPEALKALESFASKSDQ